MKRLSSLLLAALLLLSGCGPAQPSNDIQPPADSSASDVVPDPVDIPFALAVYPSYSLHPVLAENRANLTLAPLLYEPLFQLDDTFQAEGILCSSYAVSEDLLTWTFTLHSGVTFSDGTPLTGDVAASALNTARKGHSRYTQRLADVISITGAEDTVTVSLRRPNGTLPTLLDIPIALGTEERPLGTGPYVLSGTEDNLSLTAREGWWQNKPLPAQTIPLTAVSQSDALISSFASGDTGLVDVDLMGTNTLGYSGNYETWDYNTTDFLYLAFNTQRGVCQNAKVRLALARSIDRTPIVQTDYARHAAAATLPVHPASPLYDETLAQALEYAPEQSVEALESLRAAGRALTLVVNSENAAKVAVARHIAYQLESAGMDVTLNKLSFDDYTAALTAGDFDLYLGEVVLTADFDLSALLVPMGSLNYGRWEDWQADGLLSALRSSLEPGRQTAAHALFTYLNEQVPIVPICFKNGSVLTQWGRLSGLAPVRGNVFHQLENWIIE